MDQITNYRLNNVKKPTYHDKSNLLVIQKIC